MIGQNTVGTGAAVRHVTFCKRHVTHFLQVESYQTDSIKEARRMQVHNKPLPQHDKHGSSGKPIQINQPRK